MHVTDHIIQISWLWQAGAVLSVVVGRAGTHGGWVLERALEAQAPRGAL